MWVFHSHIIVVVDNSVVGYSDVDNCDVGGCGERVVVRELR